jgi:hypothetical protein
MQKRLIALLVITPLLLSSQLPTSYAAAKAGATCSKAGSKSIVGTKTFTCMKSGKKLIWLESKNKKSSPGLPGGFETSTTYSTDIGYDHQFISPRSIDPGTPSEWKAMEFQYKIDNLDQFSFRIKKYQLGLQRPKSLVTSKTDLLAAEACKMRDGVGDSFLRAFPSSKNELLTINSGSYPKPKVTIQVVPIFADDTVKTTKTPEEEYGKYFNFIKNWIEYSSDVPSDVLIRYPDRYLSFSKKLKPYGISHALKGPHPTFAKDVLAEVDSQIDFSGAQMVVVVVPGGTPLDVFQQGSLGNFITQEGVISAGSSVYPDTYSNPNLLPYALLAHPYVWLHEFFHLGISLDDHYGDRRNDVNSEYGMGSWTLMTPGPGGGDLSIWEKWILGYISDSQVRCADKSNTSLHWLAPSSVKTTEDKALVIPLSKTKVIVIESIRAAGLYYKWPKNTWGALTYVVDVSINKHGLGMKLILPQNRSAGTIPYTFAEAPLRIGESVIYEGVKISIIESGNFGEVIKVEKVA